MPVNLFSRRLALGCGCALVVLMLAGLAPSRAVAGSLVVTTTADEQNTNGACSLREAIINANNDNQSGSTDCVAGSGADRITFNVVGSIVLGSSLPDIIGVLTITGPDPASALTISGNNAVRVLKVNAGARLTLNTLSVSNGLVTNDYGGGVRNSGDYNMFAENVIKGNGLYIKPPKDTNNGRTGENPPRPRSSASHAAVRGGVDAVEYRDQGAGG